MKRMVKIKDINGYLPDSPAAKLLGPMLSLALESILSSLGDLVLVFWNERPD